GREVTRLLVLNASSHGETLDEVARRYAREAGSPLHGCIISKIDEASSFGAGLDAAIRYRLPIHFVSTGQKVPEDLLHLDAGQLVERALGAATDRPGLYAPSQDDLAALLSTSESESARQARRQRDGLDGLLAILLTGSRTGSQATSPQVFQQACEAIEEILPVAEAWDTWRATAADKATSAVSRHLDRMFRSVRLAGHARPARPVLAVHGGAMLRQVQQGQGRRGTLNASLVLDAQGGALISAVQQIALPEGWWSSDGQSARQSPSPAAALARQVDTLRTSRPDWTIVHALGSHSRVLQDQLEADGAKWISEVGRLTRFYHQGTLSTAGAIARQLDHQPVDEGEVRIDGSGRRRGPWVLWAATAPVDVVVRQRTGRRLRFVSVQLVDRADGRVLNHWCATAGATLEGATTADLGRWVAAANTGRAVMRCAADLHGSMNTDASSGQDMMVALAATQMALAAHAILHEPGELEQALLALAERPDKLDLTAAAQTLGKLFALKKWLADTAA
ncbi:MAG TPA: hypothetical protein VK104_04990, partial [Burkholderiaceae bacterium]|nr:hypothetical protein [Burkholderiaceae bacterium]